MGDESSLTHGEGLGQAHSDGTVTTLKRFVRVCLKRGKSLEQARDALLVANLDRKLVDRTLEAALFDKTASTFVGSHPTSDVSLDYSQARTLFPQKEETKEAKPKQARVRKMKKTEPVELASTPFYHAHPDWRYRRKKVRVKGNVPETFSQTLVRLALRWGFASTALFGLILASNNSLNGSAQTETLRVPASSFISRSSDHSRFDYSPDSTRERPRVAYRANIKQFATSSSRRKSRSR